MLTQNFFFRKYKLKTFYFKIRSLASPWSTTRSRLLSWWMYWLFLSPSFPLEKPIAFCTETFSHQHFYLADRQPTGDFWRSWMTTSADRSTLSSFCTLSKSSILVIYPSLARDQLLLIRSYLNFVNLLFLHFLFLLYVPKSNQFLFYLDNDKFFLLEENMAYLRNVFILGDPIIGVLVDV